MPSRQKIAAVDAAFLHMERHDTPMHVAGLQIFSLPPDAAPDYLQQLVAELKRPSRLAPPWNLRLRPSLFARVSPMWEVDRDVDLDYHVRHTALPRPGGERELGVLVSRLHSHRLDRRRPLWECHVIEGLENGRFALYTKIHHALADGVTATRLLTQPLAGQAQPDGAVAPWGHAPVGAAPTAERKKASPTARHAAEALRALARLSRRTENGVAPFAAPPHAQLNGRVTGQRRLATQQLEIARIKRVARAADASLNDVVLALCGSALRRFLKEANTLPGKSLVAAIPVSLRPPGDTSDGNAVSLMLARLGTDIADPVLRLLAIRDATRQAKGQLRDMSPEAQSLFGSLMAAPFALQTLTGLSGRTRSFINVAVSNVPGPAGPLFLGDARLEAMVPVSIAAHGQALNLTCTSYSGALHFGVLGCRDSLPHLQRLAVYLGEALGDLERAMKVEVEPVRAAA